MFYVAKYNFCETLILFHPDGSFDVTHKNCSFLSLICLHKNAAFQDTPEAGAGNHGPSHQMHLGYGYTHTHLVFLSEMLVSTRFLKAFSQLSVKYDVEMNLCCINIRLLLCGN